MQLHSSTRSLALLLENKSCVLIRNFDECVFFEITLLAEIFEKYHRWNYLALVLSNSEPTQLLK